MKQYASSTDVRSGKFSYLWWKLGRKSTWWRLFALTEGVGESKLYATNT